MKKLKNLLLNGIKTFSTCNMSVYAGYATLFIVTAIFPLIVLVISIVNLLPGYSAKDVSDILLQLLPDLDPIRELVQSTIANLKDQSGGLLASAAALTTLWSASQGVSAIQNGLNHLDHEENKSWIKNTAKQLIFTLLLVLLIPSLLFFEVLGDSAAKAICRFIEKIEPDKLTKLESTINTIFHTSSLVVLFLTFLMILLIYAKLPSVHRTMKSQLPGALITMVSWLAFTELFAFFVPKFYKASALYGSLAALFVALLWMRIMVMILFAGRVLNKAIEDAPSANESGTGESSDDVPPADESSGDEATGQSTPKRIS